MKIIFSFFALVILSACASPQVTVTSEVTVTSTPQPTQTPLPTETPAPTYTVTVEPAAQATQAAVDALEKYGVDPETYTITTEGEVAVVTDKETGEIIYKNGSWEPIFLGEMILNKRECKTTEWVGSSIGISSPTSDLRGWIDGYAQPLTDAYSLFVDKKIIKGTGNNFSTYYLGDGCWAMTYHSSNTQSFVWYFWKDQNGKTRYEKTFQEIK